MRHSRARLLAMGFLTALLVSAPAIQAANLVTFTRGQSIVVQSYEKRGSWYYFILDGGGEMGVPAGHVTRIEEYEAPPAPAVSPDPTPASPVAMQTSSPAPAGGSPSAPMGTNNAQPSAQNPAVATPNGQDPSNVMAPGYNDARFRARMSGGPAMIQPGAGGMRKPAGMGGGMGRGRIGGNPNDPSQNPYYRRDPPQTGTPNQ